MPPSFAEGLERGVTSSVVFAWQRGRIQRSSLVAKPIRVLSASEAAPLGGRGEFRLADLEPPREASAWTVARIAPVREDPDGVLVLEIGGNLNTINQLVETILVEDRAGEFRELRLGLRAVVDDPERVTVIRPPAGSLEGLAGAVGLFHGTGDLGFLVARSPGDAVPRGTVTSNGVADVGIWTGDWREVDRVFMRVSLAALRRDRTSIVLGWRDRTLRDRPDANVDDLPRRIAPRM